MFSEFQVQGSKFKVKAEKSLESGLEKTPLNYLMPLLPLFRPNSCRPIGLSFQYWSLFGAFLANLGVFGGDSGCFGGLIGRSDIGTGSSVYRL